MKTIHVIMTQDKKIWAFKTPDEVSNFLSGEKAKCKVSRNAGILNQFLHKNKEFETYLLKAMGYWVICDYLQKKEDPKQYGLLRRKLFDFPEDKELWRKVRNEATSIASEMKRKLRHTEDEKPRYRRRNKFF